MLLKVLSVNCACKCYDRWQNTLKVYTLCFEVCSKESGDEAGFGFGESGRLIGKRTEMKKQNFRNSNRFDRKKKCQQVLLKSLQRRLH